MSFAVMVSHSTRDTAAADLVCARLEAAGFRCWVAPRDIPPGAEWTAAIIDGIAASRMMVLVFSEEANASKHVAREVLYAGDHAIPILPLRLHNIVPSGGIEYYLLGLQWLDAWPGPSAAHLDALAERVGAMLGGGNAEPEDIRFTCGHCGQVMTIEAAGAGLEVACAGCGRTVTVPTASTLRPPGKKAVPPLADAVAGIRPTPSLSAEFLDMMVHRLSHAVGPIARDLVSVAAVHATSVPAFCVALAESIADRREREAFLKSCGVEPTGPQQPAPVAPTPTRPVATAPGVFTTAALDLLKSGLAQYLGPVAGYLVDQAARGTGTINELQDVLAAKILSPKDRESWLRTLGRVK